MFPTGYNIALQQLLEVCRRLKFQPHQIGHMLDPRGQHHLKLPGDFPFTISFFLFRAGQVTRDPTWHDRLELLVPLDGPMQEQMGELRVDLEAGDILIVDHLKPHQVVDCPELNTRALVVTFMSECVFAPGSPPADYAFLLPFHRKVDNRPHVLRATTSLGAEAIDALTRLLKAWALNQTTHRQAACKAWLMVLLEVLIRAFEDSALAHAQLLRRQADAVRLKPVFDEVRKTVGARLPLYRAAALCGMSKSVFSRVFKEASGMTWVNYLNHVRMTQAISLLENTTESIAAIAASLGFSDQSHFDRRFRHTFGRTPSAHRARLRSTPYPQKDSNICTPRFH